MSQSLPLPAVIDSASVAALKAALFEHRGADLSLDASAVQRVGGLGLQVILSAARTWAMEGHQFGVANASDTFTEMLRLTGAASLPEFAA